ncbi:3-hydroxyacyl-CoA dehydrogenase NAD-binding domain-containing protein [Salaquimonas pukyongi]|uniref:3-hydroxyacyl-CoA dehydrogenase NAD-binding domain-containing protein n=1 Tax=Salaquimonas pukyongi TaxID=2712698 RepID=UPI00096BB349|nr:3-hydroxyacyl-CoA dehydrogenase NAD-binding domain-containing protein [Salaquimonas pukyongi]
MGREPVTLEIRDGLAFVTIDNPPVNATSQAVRAGLAEAVQKVTVSKVRAAILKCTGRTFVAGGDISEFDKPAAEPHLPDLCNAIEASPVPWIAAMHGTVLGGGFELALSCAFRLALPDTRFGMPEVNIGIIPGAGGTQRLPRLAGAETAVEIICSGGMFAAPKMWDAGIVDLLMDDLGDAVLAFAGKLPPRPEPASQRKALNPGSEWFAAKRSELEKKARGQHSPLQALEAIEWACTMPFSEGQKRERERFLDLRTSDQSKALRHAFFAERQVAKPEILKGVEARPVERIVVVGGGLMGTGIATACLGAGCSVHILEQNETGAEAAIGRVKANIDGAIKRGKLSEEKAAAQMARLSAGCEYEAARNADLAVEAVFEDLQVKKDTFSRLAAVMPEHAILATNTSYIDPRLIFEGIANSARCLGLHFFSPAHIMKLVEIVQMPETSKQTLATGFTLASRLKKIPVLSGICDGFIGNRMLAAYRRQADYMLADGALPHEVDAAMRAFGMPMGPYELQDLTGLQIAWANRKRQAATRDPRERYVTIADRLCEMERFGQRSAMGWYRYEAGSKKPLHDPAVEALITRYSAEQGITRQAFSPEEISGRLIAAMVNEGALIVEEGIACSADDVDVVKLHGYGFPRWRGGPMFYAQSRGIGEIAGFMQSVAAQSPDSWKLSKLLS